MNGVFADGQGEFLADGAFVGICRVGCAHDFTVLRDSVFTFQNLNISRGLLFGQENVRTNFTVGRSMIVTADDNTKQVVFERDGMGAESRFPRDPEAIRAFDLSGYDGVLAFGEAADHPHNRDRATLTQVDGVTQPAPAPRFWRCSPMHCCQ